MVNAEGGRYSSNSFSVFDYSSSSSCIARYDSSIAQRTTTTTILRRVLPTSSMTVSSKTIHFLLVKSKRIHCQEAHTRGRVKITCRRHVVKATRIEFLLKPMALRDAIHTKHFALCGSLRQVKVVRATAKGASHRANQPTKIVLEKFHFDIFTLQRLRLFSERVRLLLSMRI